MSALPPKADIGTQSVNVRFVPKADIGRLTGRFSLRQELCRIPSIVELMLVCQTLLRAWKDIVAHADR